MAYETEGEIDTLVRDKENDLSELRTRMAEHFDLWALTAYEPKDADGNVKKGYQAFTSSQPRNFFDKVVDGLNRAALTIQILLPEDASQEERRKASEGEMYLYGALAAADRRLLKRAEPPLREGLGYFMCLRGLYATRALVYLPVKGEAPVFDIVPWDPLHVTWEMGSEGLIWAAYKRQASKAQIQSEYGVEIKGKTAEIIDFWDEEQNSVLVEGQFAKVPTEHKIGHVPVLVRFVGSMPSVQGKDFDSTVKYQGDSVWAASASLYEANNRQISSIMERYERSLTGSLWHRSKGGLRKIEGDPYRTYSVIPLDSDLDEEIGHLELPEAPAEAGAILGIISNDIQQSTLPYPLAYGGTQQAMSGIAFSVLSDATRSVYNPRTGAMAQAYTWLCEELLMQFVEKGMTTTELRGFRADQEKGKQFFAVQAKPDRINPEWFINVRVEPRMPRDQEKEIAMALAATQKRGPEDIPLLSKATVRETVLQLQDPDAEEDKALAEMGKALPPIMAARIAAAMKKRGDNEGAEMVMALLRPPQQAGQGVPPPALPPELIEAIVRALVASGQPQLAEAFLQAMAGRGGPGGPPPAGPESMGQGPVPAGPTPPSPGVPPPFDGVTPEMMGTAGGEVPPGMV